MIRILGFLSAFATLLAGGQAPDQSLRFQQAIENAKRAVAHYPANVDAHLALAAAYASQWIPGSKDGPNLANLRQAVAEYHSVLQIDPGNKVAFGCLGQLAYNDATTGDRSKLDDATKWYRKLVSVDPDDEQGHYFLGVIAWSNSYVAVSKARQEMHVPADYQGPLPYRTVRESLAGLYRPIVEDGIENLREALAIKPNDEDAMTYMNLLLRVRSWLDASGGDSTRDLSEAERWSLLSLETRRQKQGPPTGYTSPKLVVTNPPPPPAQQTDNLPEINSQIAEANLQSKKDPDYPPLALSDRIQGSVAFRIIIDEDGRVKRILLEHGHPLLVSAAREAVQGYVYRPFIVNGQPTAVSTEVTVQFSVPK